jgi:hypothetical protein
MGSQECVRCGWVFELEPLRNKFELCESCRARKVQRIGECLPWHGRFAADMTTPIDEGGQMVLPGVRICGSADCVQPKHIERARNG